MLFKKKDLPKIYFIQSINKETNEWELTPTLDIIEVANFKKKVFKNIIKMKDVMCIPIKSKNIIVIDYDVFEQAMNNTGMSEKYKKELENIKNVIESREKNVKLLIKDLCREIRKDYDIVTKTIECVRKNGDTYSSELADYIEHIVVLTKVQEESYNEMCRIAYEYLVKNHKDCLDRKLFQQ